MFGIIRLIIRIALLIFIGLLVLAYFTNPTLDDFKQNAKTRLNEHLQSATDNPALSYIAELGMDFTEKMIDKMVVRKNYYVCSLYSVQLPDGEYTFLGAFHMFYPLQDKNPFDAVKERLNGYVQ